MRTPNLRLFTGMLMLAAILMIWTQAIQSAVLPVEQAIEADARDVSLPRQQQGILRVRVCSNCKPQSLHVTETTRYETAASMSMSLEQFVARLREIPADDSMLVIFYLPDSRLVTRVRLSVRP